MNPKIGIVTVTYNSAVVLDDFLASLAGQTFVNWTLYVVDNASTDATLAQISQWQLANCRLPIETIANPDNKGVAAGNNQGIRAALADGCTHVLLLNNDTVFEPALIENLLHGLDEHHAEMVVPKMLYFDQPNKIWCAGGYFDRWAAMAGRHRGITEIDYAQFDVPQPAEYAPTCCMLITAKVFQDIGYMDETYFVYYDDTDFCLRARKAGIRLFYVPTTHLLHKVSSLTEGDESPFTIRYMTRNRAYYIQKNFFGLRRLLWINFCQANYLWRVIKQKDSVRQYRQRKSYFDEGLKLPIRAGYVHLFARVISDYSIVMIKSMNAPIKVLLYLIGIALWLPGIALVNIGGAWGLQIATVFSMLLLALMLVTLVLRTIRHKQLVISRGLLVVCVLFVAASLLSTVFSPIGIERSLQSFAAEMIGVVFSISLAWTFVVVPNGFMYFLRGFRCAGMVFAIYAVYQVVAFRLQLPFGYVTMNNTSFALLDEGSAAFLGRALGLTPEPSVLASLLLVLFGITFVDLLVRGGFKTYIACGVAFAGFLATGSQSIVIVPLYMMSVVAAQLILSRSRRRIHTRDLLGIGAMGLALMALVATNPAIVNSVSRLTDTTDTAQSSFLWRLNDFSTSLEMFRQNPLFGTGLGALSVQASLIRQSLALEGEPGASSGLFRMIAEQGLAGVGATVLICLWLFPQRLRRATSSDQLIQMLQHVAILFGTLLSLVLFVGYRNIFNLWLLIPVLLNFKHQYCTAHPAKIAPPASAQQSLPAWTAQ